MFMIHIWGVVVFLGSVVLDLTPLTSLSKSIRKREALIDVNRKVLGLTGFTSY